MALFDDLQRTRQLLKSYQSQDGIYLTPEQLGANTTEQDAAPEVRPIEPLMPLDPAQGVATEQTWGDTWDNMKTLFKGAWDSISPASDAMGAAGQQQINEKLMQGLEPKAPSAVEKGIVNPYYGSTTMQIGQSKPSEAQSIFSAQGNPYLARAQATMSAEQKEDVKSRFAKQNIELGKKEQKYLQEFKQIQDDMQSKLNNDGEKTFMQGVTESIAQSAPAMLRSVGVGVAAGGLGGGYMLFSDSAANYYAQARTQGMDRDSALRYAKEQGSIEAVTEYIPTMAVSKILSKSIGATPVKEIGKAALEAIVADGGGEIAANFLQNLNDGRYNFNQAVAEKLKEGDYAGAFARSADGSLEAFVAGALMSSSASLAAATPRLPRLAIDAVESYERKKAQRRARAEEMAKKAQDDAKDAQVAPAKGQGAANAGNVTAATTAPIESGESAVQSTPKQVDNLFEGFPIDEGVSESEFHPSQDQSITNVETVDNEQLNESEPAENVNPEVVSQPETAEVSEDVAIESQGKKDEVPNNSVSEINTNDVAETSDETSKYSLIEDQNSDFAKAVDEVASNKQVIGYISMGKTPDVLKMLGLPNTGVFVNGSVLSKVMGGKHNLTQETLKQLPQQLNNPIAVMKSAPQASRKGYVILTELIEVNPISHKQEPVISALHLNKTKRGFNVVNIASVYGKNLSGLQNMLNNDLLYWHNAKGSQFLNAFQLQLPSHLRSDANLSSNDIKTENNLRQYILEDGYTDKQKARQVLHRLKLPSSLTSVDNLSDNDTKTESDLSQYSHDRTLLETALDKSLAEKVTLKRGVDEVGHKAVAEGYHVRGEDNVVINIDNIHPLKGKDGEQLLSRDERLQWVAFHELFHRGVSTNEGMKLFNRALKSAYGNPVVKELANKIAKAYQGQGVDISVQKATEEALAELRAAIDSRNLKALVARWDLQARASQSAVEKMYAQLRRVVEKILSKLTGRSVSLTDSEVIQLIRDISAQATQSAVKGEGDVSLSASAMKSVEANIKRGKAAMNKAITEKADVNRAMYRNDIGWIDFVWGDDGVSKSRRSKKGEPIGMGLSHIIEARARKDGMSYPQAVKMLTTDIVETIARGGIHKQAIEPTGKSMRLQVRYKGNEANLVKNKGSNGWLLTGYKMHQDGANGVGFDTSAATHELSTPARQDVGASDANSNVSNSVEKSNDDTRYSLASDHEFDETAKKYGGEQAYQSAVENGKTELNYKQWVQVRTPAFKAWFGDWENSPETASKVVNKKTGEPLVVYHGTNNVEIKRTWNDKSRDYDSSYEKFTVFKRKNDGLRNQGLFFNNVEDNAGGYGSYLYSTFLSLKKPLIINANGEHFTEVNYKGEVKDTYEWAEYAEKKGYDGVIFENVIDGVDYNALQYETNDYVAFKSNQIKSATDNTGDFSASNDDIRYSLPDEQLDEKYLALAKRYNNGDVSVEPELRKMVENHANSKGFNTDTSFRMDHSAPNANSDYSVSGDKLDEIMGDDIYGKNSIDYFGTGDSVSDRESIAQILKMKGNPDQVVTVYRAIPKGFKGTAIGDGDWVTLSKNYAEQHGESLMLNDYKIAAKQVKAGDIYWNGDSINEFGYDSGKGNYRSANFDRNKSPDLITYDDEGEIIPLSHRFNAEKEDVRYSLNESPNSEFAKAVDDVVAGRKPKYEFTPMGTTPDVLQLVGMPNSRVLIGRNVFKKVLGIQKSKDGNVHFIKAEDLRQLPAQINNPVAVMKSSKNATVDGYVVLTELVEENKVSKQDEPVIAALHVKHRKDGVEIVNIASVYGKNMRPLQRMLDNDLLYWNKTKGLRFLRASGLQLPLKIARNASLLESASNSNAFRLQLPLQLRSNANLSVNDIMTDDDLRQYQSLQNGEISYSINTPEDAVGATSEQEKQGWIKFAYSGKDTFIRRLQDRFRPIKQLQDAITANGGKLNLDNNTYLAEERYHGQVENDLRLLRKRFVEPLAELMQKYSITQAALDDFLIMRHAQERNEVIAKRNKAMPDGGSGVKTADAQAYLADLKEKGLYGKFMDVAQIVYKMNELQRQVMASNGLVSDDVVNTWNKQYKYYVPLKGIAQDNGGEKGAMLPRTGRGYNIGGKEVKIALGRSSKAVNPTAQAISDLTEKLVRAQKNIVGKHLLQLVRDNPDKAFWEIFTDEKPDYERGSGKGENGVQAKPVAVQMWRDTKNYFAVKENGKIYYIKINDPILMNALNNITPAQVGAVLSTSAKVNRYLAAMNTSFSPEFVVSNFLRDVQTAYLNLNAEASREDGKIFGREISNKMMKYILSGKPSRAIWAHTREKNVTDPDVKEWVDYYEEFMRHGAKTGFVQIKDTDAQRKALDKMLGESSPTWGTVKKTANAIVDVIDDANNTVENQTRLAAYVAAREAGFDPRVASSLAKNMTVNFNRRGEYGATISSLYMFANASIQGSANFFRTMGRLNGDGKLRWRNMHRAQRFALLMVAAGFVMGFINRLISGEDDDGVLFYDKIPDFVKERNIIIMKNDGKGGYWKIPLPYGYNIFPLLGSTLESMIFGKQSLPEASWTITKALLGSFSPISLSDSSDPLRWTFKNIVPSAGKPIAELVMNENFTGAPIHNDNRSFGAQLPNSSNGRLKTPEMYKQITQTINRLTGGSEYRSGWFDIYPETLRHIVNTVGGGALRFWGVKVASTAYDKVFNDIDLSDQYTGNYPFLSMVSAESLPYEDQTQYYKRRDEILQIANERKHLGKAGLNDELKSKLRLYGAVRAADSQLKALRKKRDKLYADQTLTARERFYRMKEIEERMGKIIDRFNKRYNQRIAK